MIKNIGVLLLSLCMAMVVVSCVDDDDVQTSSDCYIESFSVGDIESEVTEKLSDGRDTVVTRTISGSSVYFNISQVDNIITVVDSLPDWTDLTKIVPTVSSTGYVYIKREGDTDFMGFNNGSEEVDFTKPVQFLVLATDEVSTKTYTAKIFKRKVGENDSLMWTKISMPVQPLQLEGKHRSVVVTETKSSDDGAEVKNFDRIYVFAENGGKTVVTSASQETDFRSWRRQEEVDTDIDWQSVTVFKNNMYALGKDGKIYQTTAEYGKKWTVAADNVVERLLGADNTYIYAYDGINIVGSSDLQNWAACGGSDMDMLPQTCVSSVWYTSRTNDALSTVVMSGLTDNNPDNAVVWYKVSSADESLNQYWNYIQVDESNEYGCPKLENMSMVCYNGELFAIGGKYEGLYISKDNGISWKLQTVKKNLPKEVRNSEDKEMSLAVGGGYLWLIRSGGEVWRGKM